MKNIDWEDVAIVTGAAVSAILIVLMILFAAGCFKQTSESVKEEPAIEYVIIQKEQVFDTSIIETQWGGGFEDGTVRMVGAWHYADGVIEDEQGQLWGIEQNIKETDFLLLWIADNNTPNEVTDDIIVKVWREAY